MRPRARDDLDVATEWFELDGRPVTIMISTPGAREGLEQVSKGLDVIEGLEQVIGAIRAGLPAARAPILLVDCGAPGHPAHLDEPAAHLAELAARHDGVQALAVEAGLGFAEGVNRALEQIDGGDDVVLLGPDVAPQGDWLAFLQWTAYRSDDVGVVGAKLLYADGRIEHAGVHRDLRAPERFTHRWRSCLPNWPPAEVVEPALAVSAGCMYLKREAIERAGRFDPDVPAEYAHIDYCLRVWRAGYRVLYGAGAQLMHLEAAAGATPAGEPDRSARQRFWRKWRDALDARPVHTREGRLRIVYVLEDTGVGGGTRVIFEHLNRLAERGHEVALWTVKSAPTWFDLRCEVREFGDYDALTAALGELDAIKVATWWNTAAPVWRASILRGIPVYFVQDIETSYYPGDLVQEAHILNSYRPEFHYLTTSGWLRERLSEFGLGASIVAPGIDLGTFRPLPNARREDVLLAIGRSNPLKNLPLTVDAWRALPEPRPELCLFGIEPQLGPPYRARYVERPADEEVNELLNEATLFVQTSVHEGFCLPALEAMAAGAPVVCTDADGNRDYCRDGENCLMPVAEPAAVAAAIGRLLGDRDLRERIAGEGRRTAQCYSWERCADELEAFFYEVSERRAGAPPPPRAPGPASAVAETEAGALTSRG
jgi:glycosyltransferase involved in cell wall biosynthesis